MVSIVLQSKEIIDMPDFGIMRGFNEKLFGDKLVAGQLPTQLGLIGSQEVSDFLGLLDTYPNAAGAYALRGLRIAYTGNLIRVRRSSDNAEQDIGFINNVNRNLDTTALTTFCSGTDGFVTTWYDQSGNGRNATQSTAANQPQIVSSGSVLTDNGKPTIRFDGINDSLIKTSFGFPTTNISISKVNSRIGNANYSSIGYSSLGGFLILNQNNAIGFDGRPNGGAYSAARATTTGTTNQILQLNIYDGSNLKASLNGNAFITTAVSANPIVYGNQNLYFARESNTYYNCNTTEFIMWGTDQTSNKSGIDSNINLYYGIY